MGFNRLRFYNLGRPEGLREEDFLLTPEQVEILEEQIRKNKDRIDHYVALIDRLVNIESYPKDHPKAQYIRQRMQILMSENNTFRQNLWRHWLLAETPAFNY